MEKVILAADTVLKNYYTRQTGYTTRLAFEAAAEAKMGHYCVILTGNDRITSYISNLICDVFSTHIERRTHREIDLFGSRIVFLTTRTNDHNRIKGRTIDCLLIDNSVDRIPDELFAALVPMMKDYK